MLKVFVVDDEAIISTTLAVILKQSGFEAFSYTNPLMALEDAKSHLPNLLVSDVRLRRLTC
jgi:DNA-binding response OmpR family regulator